MMQNISIPESFEHNAYAIERFTRQVTWANQYHPFYQRFCPSPETNIPLLTRDHILDNNKLFLNGHTPTDATSGSTGIRVEVSFSKERKHMEKEDDLRIGRWLGGFLPNTRIVSLAAHSHMANTLEINSPIEAQIQFILKRYQSAGAISLVTYPTNMERLCFHVIEHKVDMSFIRRIVCMSEAYEPNLDTLIKQAFPNAKAWSSYSCSELGKIAFRCPTNPNHHHVMSHKLGIEILNDNDQPCTIGEVGRLVITDYYNRRSPFIRYEIGDLAAPALCECELNNFQAIQNIAGKVRGALKLRNGQRVMFTDLSKSLRKTEGIRQFQIIQNSIDDFVLRLVPNKDWCESETYSQVKTAFNETFGYCPNIIFKKEDKIEREKNGKYYASICNI